MVTRCIYIRKALERIDARNNIKEREKRLAAENDAERR